MVFQELAPSQSHKVKSRSDLESELFGNAHSANILARLRDNEGEAAEYGVYFDDTEYDYMQHMRDSNCVNGDEERYIVNAESKSKASKGKERVRLEDALREASLDDRATENEGLDIGSSLLDEDVLPSRNLRRVTYQDQQDIPDALAGFQPDMDPRLREVLEALEDEAYVGEEEEFFGELAKDGKEVSMAEFKELQHEDDGDTEDDGWETDDTVKPARELDGVSKLSVPTDTDVSMEECHDHDDDNWMREFNKFKKSEAINKENPRALNPELQSSILTGTSMTGGRRKKRKGAMTSSTGYSMTSSSLLRTEGLTLLDARFDKIEEEYAEDPADDDDGEVSVSTGTSSSSSQAPPLRSDFDGIMDDFLDGYSMNGRKRIRKGGYQSGIEQLDEIRKGLGPARVRVQKAQ